MMMTFYLSVLLLICIVGCPVVVVESAALGRTRHEKPTQRNVLFRNNSGRRVDVFWVNVFKEPNEFVSQNANEGYPYGGDTNFLSYIGHEFEVREMFSKKTGSCKFDECRKVRFQVNDQENQVVEIDSDFNAILEDDRQRAISKADELFQQCKKKLEEDATLSPLDLVDGITDCMEVKLNETLTAKAEERDFQKDLRLKMSKDLIPYACGDVNFTDTTDAGNVTWTYTEPDGYRDRININILHERPTSEIIAIRNFATKEECKAIRIYEENNSVPFKSISEKTAQGTQLFQLATKLYSLARAKLYWDNLDFAHMNKLGFHLFDHHKDEVGLTVPKLLCVGDAKTAGEAAAKGTCRLAGAEPIYAETKPFIVEDKDQIAQVFLFCDEPDTLGGLHFPYAGVHVSPEMGKLVMAINRQRDDEELDGYVGEYHLCPNHNVYTHTFVEKTFE